MRVLKMADNILATDGPKGIPAAGGIAGFTKIILCNCHKLGIYTCAIFL
jgi:hypothetical protein